MAAASYTVSIGSFEGPFDLLLHLIARQKVDIYEIQLAQITDDYIAAIRGLEVLDLEVATEFLVVAATLVELKAARLLPGEDDPEFDELALEARDLLYARLLDYRTFKEAAGWLRGRLDEHLAFYPREVALEPAFVRVVPSSRLEVTAVELAHLAARALQERPAPAVDVSHLQPVRITVREAAANLVDELIRAGGSATFAELTAGCRHRIELIVHFLAALELYKDGRVSLHQAERCGAITVAWDRTTGPPSKTASEWQGSPDGV